MCYRFNQINDAHTKLEIQEQGRYYQNKSICQGAVGHLLQFLT